MAMRGRGASGGRGGGRKPFTVSTKLYIGNIPETCRKMDLQKLFEQHGNVVECDIVKNYGFVVCKSFIELISSYLCMMSNSRFTIYKLYFL